MLRRRLESITKEISLFLFSLSIKRNVKPDFQSLPIHMPLLQPDGQVREEFEMSEKETNLIINGNAVEVRANISTV